MGSEYKGRGDWEVIELEYRMEKYGSVRALAKAHGVSESTIRNRAKGSEKKGIPPWTKNFVDEYQKGVETGLIRRSSATEETEDEVLKMAVDTAVEVIHRHKKKIGRLSEIYEVLSLKLLYSVQNEEDNHFLKNNKSSHEGVFDMATKLARTLESIIKLERQAFNLDAKSTTDPNNSGDVDLEDRIKKHMVKCGFNE